MALTKVQTIGIETGITFTGITTTSSLQATEINVSGIATFGGNVSIAGTLTYEDVTDIDSVGLITARSGVNITDGGLVVVGVTTVSAGSASAPSISPSGDPDTGLYSPGADQLALATGGTGRLFIDSSGRLGVGINSPQSPLTIGATSDFGAVLCISRTDTNYNSGMLVLGNGNSTDKYVAVWRGAANSVSSGGEYLNLGGYDGISFATGAAAIGSQTERARIDSSGRLLVGTTTTTAASRAVFQGRSDGANLVADIYLQRGQELPTGANTLMGRFYFANNASAPAAIIEGSTGDAWTASSHPGQLVFSTTPSGSTTPVERMRLDSSGRLGVGTNSPASSLNFGDAAANSGIQFGDSADFTIKRNTTDTTIDFNVGSDLNHFQWKVGGINYMRLDSSGRLGIGTTSPGGLLEIKSADANPSLLRLYNAINSATSWGVDFYRDAGAGNNVLRAEVKAVRAGNDATDLKFSTTNVGGTLSERARIDYDGRLLVGTSSSIGGQSIQVGTSTGTLGLYKFANNDDGGEITLANSRNASIGSHTVVNNNDFLGRIFFRGSDGSAFWRGAEIAAQVDGTPGANDMPGRLVFSTTADGANSPTTRLQIKNTGRFVFLSTDLIYPDSDNAVSLGGSGVRWSAVWAANGTIQTSDQRAKTEINDANLGSDFIKSLRPVSYKWIEGGKRHTGEYDDDNNWTYESVPGTRTHWGFIAQEVKQAVDAAGVDFGGWVLTDKDDPDSQQALRYDQFIAPLTKALQEALAEIDVLKAKVAALEAS